MQLHEAQTIFAGLATVSDIDDARALAKKKGPSKAKYREMLANLTPERAEVYQGLIRGSLWGAMEKCFALTRSHLGERWARACRLYFEKYPPDRWDLNELGCHFPEFLSKFWLVQYPSYPLWLPELASYELVELETFLAEEAPRMENPASVDLPHPNPTMHLCCFAFDIASWVKKREDGHQNLVPENTSTITAVFRDSETRLCRFLNVSSLAATALESWHDQESSTTLAVKLAPMMGVSIEQCQKGLHDLARELAEKGAVTI